MSDLRDASWEEVGCAIATLIKDKEKAENTLEEIREFAEYNVTQDDGYARALADILAILKRE